MKYPLLITALVLFSTAKSWAQDEPPLTVSTVATSGATLKAFVPTGWKVEKQIIGDLNRDKVSDAALVLVKNIKNKDADGYVVSRPRALIVALKSGKSWRLAGVNNKILMGTHDGGAFWGMVETPVDVSIKKGILIVEQESGAREMYGATHRFRYDASKKGFFLIGLDTEEHDRGDADSKSSSINYLTGRREDQAFPPDKPSTRKKSRVSTKLRAFEAVGYVE